MRSESTARDNRDPRERQDAASNSGAATHREELVLTIRQLIREEIQAVAPIAGEMLTIAQAAALAGYGVTKIREWLKAGTLRRYGEGRGVRVNRRELQELMARQHSQGTTSAEIERMAERVFRGRR